MRETIFAPATAPGRAGVAILRLSGPDAFAAVDRLTASPRPAPRRASRRTLRWDGAVVDEAVVLLFPAPGSYTGEDVAELHVHGSIAVIRRLSVILAEIGLRLAGPGEFTRRALIEGRMSLPEVEALGDLIDAETDLQRALSLGRLRGATRQAVDDWRTRLRRAMALLETAIDFGDEDVPPDVALGARDLIAGLRRDVASAARAAGDATTLMGGYEVALVGPPNSGKSSLLNRLTGREAALVSQIPGTTRDVIEVRYDLNGLPVVFLDTAGVRETEDEVEGAGIARAIDRAQAAALRVFLAEDAAIADLRASGDIVARAFADLRPGDFSSRTGEGIDALLGRIHDALIERVPQDAAFAGERQRSALNDALAAFERAEEHLAADVVLAAEELRMAQHSLAALVGEIGTEEVLGEIFASFCIGK